MASILSLFRRQPRSTRKSTRRRSFLERLEDRLALTANLLSISDAYVEEGNSGTASAVFTVTVDQPSALPITVEYFTWPADAEPWVDYDASSGVLTIGPGQTSGTISVSVLGDTVVEADEQFYLVLANPTGATLQEDYWGIGTIGNDDTAVPNDPPIAVDDAYEVPEDYILSPSSSYGVLSNDFDPELGSLQAILVSGPTHGQFYLDASGSFYYIPDANYFGTDSFTYRAKDDAGLSDLATVTITVWSIDDPIELITPESQTTAEESPLTFSAANGNAITVADIESPRVFVALGGYYGTVTLQNTADVELLYPQNNGTNYISFYADSPAEANAALEGVVFTPELHFNGTAHLTVLIQDMDSQTYYPAEDWAAIAITVTGVNDPPLAQNDYYEWAEDMQLVVSANGVLQNDYDIEWSWLAGGGGNPPLTAVLVDGPAHGSVALNSDGSFTYTPNANFFGTDSFTYRAADESSQSNLATVTLTIWAMNDPIEVAVPSAQTIAEDTAITFSAANGNAFTISDIESPRIIVGLQVQDGILTLPSTAGLEFPYAESTNNSSYILFYADNPAEANAALDGLVFTPSANFNGQVYLTLYVQDTTFAFPPAEAFDYTQITVTPVNDAPVAVNDSYTAESGVPFWATLGGGGSGVGVLMNDQDVDWDLLSAVLVSGPSHGTFEFNSDGTFIYTADPTYSGTDSFTYRAFDGQVESGLATATITVTLNQPPVSVGDAYAVNEDSSLSVPGLGVLGNDSDPNGTALTAHLVSGPAHGTLTLNPYGSFTYTPTTNYFGTDEFWYRSFDGTYYSDSVVVNLTINPVNDVPVATGDSYSVDEDVVLTVAAAGVLVNDSDIDSATLTAALVAGPSHGVLSLGANGSFIYTPSANYFGSDSFTYRANDGQSNSNIATVSITVNAVNDAPLAVNDSYAAEAGVPFWATLGGGGSGVGVLMNDQDVDLDSLSATLVSGPAHGTLEFNSDGTFTYTADPTYSGTDSFTYRAFDGHLESGLATATFTVTRDDPPVSVGDAYAVNEDSSLSAPAPGVLGNDSDPNGTALTAHLVSGPAHGTLTLNPSGSFTYTPTANYFGPDEFWYRSFDGTHYSDPVAVNLTVNPVNDAPVATGNTYSVDEDVVLTVAAAGVLGNDSDIDSATLTAALVAGPSHGVLSLGANGSFIYTPSANHFGSDSFTYRANDGQSNSNIATVSITVNAVNDAPLAVNDTYSLNEDQTLTITPLPGVFSLTMVSQPGDYIGQGQTYSYTPQTGTFTANRNFDNGVSVHYSGGGHWWNLHFAAPFNVDLAPGFYANATRWPFQAANVPGLSVSGDGRGSNTLTGNFTVTQAVYAANGSVLRLAASFEQHNEGFAPALTGTINFNQGEGPGGILVNDSDVEGNPLAIIMVTGPAHGTLGMNVDGSFTYQPTANYNGVDSFTYRLSDGTSEGNLATVTLTVNAVNDFPTANHDSYTVAEDNVLTVGAPGVLANDFDVDGDSLTATLVTPPTQGSLTFNSNGSFTYAPNANYNGTDIFKYAARDASGWLSFIRTVTLTVTSVNDPPTASDDSYTTAEDTPLTVAAGGVLGNDTDLEGSALSALLVAGPAHGTLTLSGNGSFTYTPGANFNGTDSFTYKASDGAANSNVVTVTLAVTAVNDAPTAGDDAYVVAEDQNLVVAAAGVLGNDGDVDGGSLSAALVSGPAQGTLTLNADGSFNYTAHANYNGSDSFTYRANDGSLDSNVATVHLTITATADAPTAADDAYTVNEDNSLNIAASGVLGNDSDVDGNSLSAVLVSGPAHGSLTWNSDGSFTYTPHANFHGGDSFTYKANDGGLDSNIATVSLTVASVNDAPTATDDAYTLAEDQPLTVSAGVLANDGDLDGGSLSAVLVSGPANGTLTLNADGSFNYTAHANYNGSDSFTYKASDGNADSNIATVLLTISAVNDAPVAVAGPDRQSDEGATVTFDALGSFDVDGGNLTYSWNFGDGGTASGFSVQHAYADEGTYTVTLMVGDGLTSTTDTLVMTVFKVAPVATVSGPGAGVRGQTQTFTFGALDPSPADQAADFTYSINWGDGNTQTVTGPNSTNVDHVFAATGTYTVSVQATDKDGVLGNVVQHTITVSAVLVQGGNLLVGGTTSGDTINLKVADTSGGVRVTINGANQGVFNPSGAIYVYAQAGTDNVKFETTKFNGQTRYIQDAAFVFGGDGNDSLDAGGSSAKNVIVGDAGNDTMWGGTGRDILIGGLGTDTLRGGGDDDLLIGNGTTCDTNLTALAALMAEWGRTNASYSVRTGHLLGDPGGLNGGFFLNPNTVLTDSAIDQLYGEGGLDLFFTGFSGPADSVNDFSGGEMKAGL